MKNITCPRHIQLLQEILKSRMERNPNYSLRAFARDLGVHVSTLSRAFSRKVIFSPEITHRILEKLNLSDAENREFIGSIELELEEKYRGMKMHYQILTKKIDPVSKPEH